MADTCVRIAPHSSSSASTDDYVTVRVDVYCQLFQPADSWVTVHKLQSLADGGILDPDDALVDVVDDKDQVD